MGSIREKLINFRNDVTNITHSLKDYATLIILCGPFNPLSCGYTTSGHYYYDRDIGLVSAPAVGVHGIVEVVKHNPSLHGDLDESTYVKEGDRVPNQPNSTEGKIPIHRHRGKCITGPYKFTYE